MFDHVLLHVTKQQCNKIVQHYLLSVKIIPTGLDSAIM